MSWSDLVSLLTKGLLETLYMTLASTAFAYVLGLPMGVALVVTDKNGLHPLRPVNVILNLFVNLMRSIPFLILLIAVIPFTRFLVGTSIGSTATAVPLVLAAAPFIARLVEQSLNEVDRGVVEAALSMGASPWQVIRRVLLPEARPSLLLGAAIALTTILGYSAMAGIVGGGGLGDIAIRYGYYRYQRDTMLVTVLVLVAVVQVFQEIGARIAKLVDKRK